METHEWFNVAPFWDDEYKKLNYTKEKFNDPGTEIAWEDAGFRGPFGGWMCDMRNPQPSWNQQFINFFERYEHWKDIGTSYYRMDPGSSLPNHVDTYRKYIELYDLKGQEHSIRRAVVFLEDRRPGHFAECQGRGYSDWIAGFTLVWPWNAPHGAYNMGFEPRYTLQITGHV
jgi:hypothetical protein